MSKIDNLMTFLANFAPFFTDDRQGAVLPVQGRVPGPRARLRGRHRVGAPRDPAEGEQRGQPQVQLILILKVLYNVTILHPCPRI